MRPALLTAPLLLATSCIVEAPTGDNRRVPESAYSPARAMPGQQGVQQAPPQALAFKNGADFDHKVQLLATTVSPAQAQPGEQVHITMFFKVLEDVNVDYTIFVHVEDIDQRAERMNLDHKPAGGQMPTTQWKKGQTIKDDFGLYVPPGVPVRGFILWAGFWDPKTDARMKVMNPEQVRTDGHDRVLVGQVQIAQ